MGLGPRSSLLVHDPATVQLGGRWQSSAIEHRALLLAGDGDVVALWAPRVPAFERYCREVLGLGSVEVLRPASPVAGASLATRVRRDPVTLARLAEIAAANAGLNVHPYIGSGGIWALAAAIAARAGVAVSVAAPPPRLTRCVNDKLWFASRASELLGARSLPPTRQAYSLAVLAERVRALAREHDRVAIKLPSAAGGEGNAVVDAARFRDLSLPAARDSLRRLLLRLGWSRPFPLLVSVWESPVAATPSVQLWIPEAGVAPPLVEGIFEQQVHGPAAVFVGAVPADLPRHVRERIAREAVLLATLFQELGYFGRCSFDAILVGRDADRAEVHWVECNGRWGGTSIPMTLVNRLAGDWADAPFAVVAPGSCIRRGFSEALERLRGRLFVARARSGIVFLSPGRGEAGEEIAFLAISRTVEEARRDANEALAILRAPGGT